MWFDVAMVKKYSTSGRQGYAIGSMVCLSLCLGVQMIIAWALRKELPFQSRVGEQLLILSLLKPGVDAWRAATFTKSDRKEGSVLDPNMELTYNWAVEVRQAMSEATSGRVFVIMSEGDIMLLLSLRSSRRSSLRSSPLPQFVIPEN